MGGLKRSKSLSQLKRSLIAARAAQIRWGKTTHGPSEMSSVRLDHPQLDDPVFLEELLAEGSLETWKRLYQKIIDYPFGREANALEKVLSSLRVYGVTPLWQGLLRRVRGGCL